MARPSGNLIIGGQAFPTDAPIVNFRDPPNWDASSTYCKPTKTDAGAMARCKPGAGGQIPYALAGTYVRRYMTRPGLRTSKYQMGESAPYEAVKGLIKQFVIHHDGCASADMCFNVLQNERGLSCHFLVDNDGTIYQTLDLALAGYHAGLWNSNSIGVELCNRGDAKKEPNYYKGKDKIDREPRAAKINGHTFLAWNYTPMQYDAMTRLCRALLRLLPNLPADYPQSSPGIQSWDTIPTAASLKFAGYIGHYHLIPEKWDPGYFDFKEFCSKLTGTACYPVYPRAPVDTKNLLPPAIPNQVSALRDDTKALYKKNEIEGDSGYFPVGRWGEERLWHGGVHLAMKEGDPVFAAFPGRVVAARMGAPASQAGSVNFVLMRHSMSLGTSKFEFFSLYMHLADELRRDKPVEWMARESKEGWKVKGKPGQVSLLDEAIDAGTVLGHVGVAGPAELSRSQLHLQIFANSHVFEGWPSSPWEVIDGTSGGRFSDAPTINDPIDSNKDGLLSKQEIHGFYTGGNVDRTHFMVTQHVSEWHVEPSWNETLRASQDFRRYKPAEIEALVSEQITPGLWLDPTVAAFCKLNSDGVMYHYHPVTFISWFNQQILDQAQQSTGPQADARDAKGVPDGITDDRDGVGMRSESEVVADPCDQMTLQDLVKGYDKVECVP